MDKDFVHCAAASLAALQRKRARLVLRAGVLRSLRAYFDANGFLEVETPVRIPVPAMEPFIDVEESNAWFLRTSPELHMKRMLCAGFDRLFQIGPCFRKGERGAFHAPEYTMLEWYETGADYMDILRQCKEALTRTALDVLGSTTLLFRDRRVDLGGAWQFVKVQDAYREYAAWDPFVRFDQDRFDSDMSLRIEPALAVSDVPVVLLDYPVEAAALSRCRPGVPAVAERWEIYVAGLELANAYSELVEFDAQLKRFRAWAAQRGAEGRAVYALDEDFLAALSHGMPECAGVALGVDRLMMLFSNASDIEEVRAFIP